MKRIDVTQKKCELCNNREKQIKIIYCNHCDKSHQLCVDCITENIHRLQIKPVKMTTMFSKNILKWR